MTAPSETTIHALLELSHTPLFDAYGVLVHSQGPLPGARDVLQHLNSSDRPYFVVTNDSSKLPNTSSERFAERGLQIPPDRIISSGSLIDGWFRDNAMHGAACVVLGPKGSHDYVRNAGGSIIPALDLNTHADVILIGDDEGYPFQTTIDATLSRIFQLIDAGTPPRLVLPNPDLIYPSGPDTFGITSGSVAMILETALAQRYPSLPASTRTFERLGKPYTPIFREAQHRSQTRDLLMIGDQLATDILGANRFGIHSALVPTGVNRLDETTLQLHEASPTWLLPHGLSTPA